MSKNARRPVRVIPCLDIAEGRVVKGVAFENIRDAGDPVEIAALYTAQGADELVTLDIYATIEARSNRFALLRKIAAASGVPLCSGGGYASIGEIEQALAAGAAKVAVNSAALKSPAFLKEAAGAFPGRIVSAIDVERAPGGGFRVLVNSGRAPLDKDAVDWAKQVQDLGACEIVLTSHDADGTKDGYDLQATAAVADAVSIPVIASGGAGKLSDFVDAVTIGHADAVLAASLFHFRTFTVAQVKQALREAGLPVVGS